MIVDVGAGLKGSYERLSKRFRGELTIYAIEPHPVLAEKIRQQRMPGVIVDRTAIAQPKEVQLYCSVDASSSSTLPIRYENARRWKYPVGKRWLKAASPPVITVPAMTLDMFVEKHQIRKIDFLNIDVQGCAVQVLSSLSNQRIWDSIKELRVKVHTIDFEMYAGQSKNYDVMDCIRKHYFDLKEVSHISENQEDVLDFYSTLAANKGWRFIGWSSLIQRL